jgi:hypothetical protein
MAKDFINITLSNDVQGRILPSDIVKTEYYLKSNKPFAQIVDTNITTPIFFITGLYGDISNWQRMLPELQNLGATCIFVENSAPHNFNIKQINPNIGTGLKGLILVKYSTSEDYTIVSNLTAKLQTVYDTGHYSYIEYQGSNISKPGYSIIYEPTF